MTDILALLDHSTTSAALIMARRWCKGRRIGADDALTHALRVVDTLQQHIYDVTPDVVAAALLHDSPDLAPSTIDLDATLATLSPEVARLVRALQHEHDDLDTGTGTGTMPTPPTHDVPLMQASAADKIVSIQAVLDRASISADTAAFWTQRRGFMSALPYFRAFHQAAEPVLPPAMAADLGHLVSRAEQCEARTDGPYRAVDNLLYP